MVLLNIYIFFILLFVTFGFIFAQVACDCMLNKIEKYEIEYTDFYEKSGMSINSKRNMMVVSIVSKILTIVSVVCLFVLVCVW